MTLQGNYYIILLKKLTLERQWQIKDLNIFELLWNFNATAILHLGLWEKRETPRGRSERNVIDLNIWITDFLTENVFWVDVIKFFRNILVPVLFTNLGISW